MTNRIKTYLIFLFLTGNVFYGAEPIEENNALNFPWTTNPGYRVPHGQLHYELPPNPMNDRAKGYLLKGKAQAAITNYGRFIDWDYHPAGLWGNYTYLPAVGFVAGIPGQSYSYHYDWTNYEESGGTCPEANGNFVIWCSNDAYLDPNDTNPNFSWIEHGDTNFVSVVFESAEDRGILGEPLLSPNQAGEFEISCDFNAINQYCLDDENNKLMISLPLSDQFTVDPNNSNAYGDNLSKKTVGMVFPWAMRPALDQRLDDFDMYNYGPDDLVWTEDDEYMYYGANVAESWFTRWSPSSNTDWHAATGSKENTHNTLVDEGDVFGDINYLDAGTFPLLAHSDNAYTWPTGYNENNELVPKWPGWYADTYAPEETGCFPAKRWNDDCWMLTDRFISDTDVYMEFDDRWAHKGNMVTNNNYEQLGYPMGLRVMAEAHSYGVSFAEDIMFVTVKVRNESGDNWCAFEKDRYGNKVYVTDNDGELICGEGMVMPDGTKLNAGKGFTYKGTSMGFYMDADVATANKFGNFGVHSNDDDFMEYFDCKNPDLDPDGCDIINDDTLRVSVAMIYDYSFGPPEDIGIVATQLLDSPYATEEVDLNGDGYADLYPGDKLQMTDWHWFDWYNRPGVVFREGDAGCCAGNPGTAQAANKEEIMYKVISGDTTNLTDDEKLWFFHTADAQDSPEDINPHFDSLEGLEQTTFFTEGSPGLDCVLQMSCGPFSLEVGEQVPFSFCVIFGQNYDDLITNATFAQLMYNSHYQGYTSPDTPTVEYSFGADIDNPEWYGGAHHAIELTWDDRAENSSDVVTGYADFEGYNIYRSTDGGVTWGDPLTDLYDINDPDSWKPYAQYHMTAEQDSLHCTFAHDYHGECSISNPEFYVLNDCYTDCLHQMVEDDCNSGDQGTSICEYVTECYGDSPTNIENSFSDSYLSCLNDFNEKFENCKDSNWNTCSSSCEQISVGEYISSSDLDQLDYSPIYGVVDCDEAAWGGNADGIPDIRGYNVCGYDPHYLIKGDSALGNCSAKEMVAEPYCSNDVFRGCQDDTDCETGVCVIEKEVGIKRTFVDTNVIDGYEYTYAVTAFDMGIASDFITTFNEDLGILQETPNTANPLHFASPDGYQSIETSKGRTANDKNFVSVISGPEPTQSLSDNIVVAPNPYIVNSNYNETEYKKKLYFFGLPEDWTLQIFTITGEKVATLEPNPSDPAKIDWDLRTVNNQEVAPGLYIFTVENKTPGFEGEKHVGKFAIVR